MVEQVPIDLLNHVYYILLLVGVMLLLILLINNFVIYRRKFKDHISMMLLACFATNVCEILWSLSSNTFHIRALVYIFAIGYIAFFLIFASIFSSFLLDQFHCLPKRKWVRFLIFVVPVVAYFILSITTPWTGIIFSIGDNYILNSTIVFDLVFTLMIFAYILISVGIAIYRAIKNRARATKLERKVALILITFCSIFPFFEL